MLNTKACILLCMYTRLKRSKKAKYPTLQIVEGIRIGKKVTQRTVAHLGVIKNKEDLKKLLKLAENLIKRLEKEGLPVDRDLVKDLIHKSTTYDGFGLVVDKLMDLSSFSRIVRKAQGKKSYDIEKVVKLVIAQRLDIPSSKLRTYERQKEHGFYNIDLQHIYRAMDALEPYGQAIQQKAFEAANYYCPEAMECFFFDVTTLYFESVQQDDMKDFGFSKDQKNHSVQIVLALVVNSQGIPICYETFKGNLAETKTLIPVFASLKKRFSIKNIVVVCDRGMASKTNIEALQDAAFDFIIATKLRSISKKHEINDLSKYQPLPNQKNVPEENKVLFHTMEHPQYSNTKLIVTYSKKRALKDKNNRERLIEKLKQKLVKPNETYIKKVISNSGYKKYTNVKKGSVITLNQQAIDLDASWDGFHGIAVSNSSCITEQEALARYKNLWRVEETFRVMKCTLKARPIFHWTSSRIKSHILLCFMTLFLERFLELLLRKNNTPLTPDKIRYALSQVHTMHFQNKVTNEIREMRSAISSNVIDIFKVLGIPLNRLETTNVVPEF